jgi:hypothetical protein
MPLPGLEVPPPPEDLSARCLATIPARAPASARPGTFAWLRKGNAGKRLVFAAAALAAVAFWTTRPVPRENGAGRPAPSVAFAQTVEAMRRVTFWRTANRGIGLTADNQGTNYRYLFDQGWYVDNHAFDAERGLYTRGVGSGGGVHLETLTLPNGDEYSRRYPSSGNVTVRITHRGADFWRRRLDDILLNIRNPFVWAQRMGFGGSGVEPPIQKRGQHWKGRPRMFLSSTCRPQAISRGAALPPSGSKFTLIPSRNSRLPSGILPAGRPAR